ncbi:MAG: hypothetical protein ABI977_01800 [Acidobacteriota bacterium]
MMKSLKKLFSVSFLSLALAVSGAAGVQGFGQDKKPPEPVKEREKQNDKKDDRKDDNKKNDDRRSGDKKKP